MKQVVFSPVNLNYNISFILQSNLRVNLLFNYLEPKDLDNECHVTDLFARRNFHHNMPKELEDANKSDTKIESDTKNNKPHKVYCTLDDERIYMASSDDTNKKKIFSQKKMQVEELQKAFESRIKDLTKLYWSDVHIIWLYSKKSNVLAEVMKALMRDFLDP